MGTPVGKTVTVRATFGCAVAVLALAGCGGSTKTVTVTTSAPAQTATTPATTTTGSATTTTAAPVTRLTVFLLRDGKVAAVTRTVPATTGVGAAALRELAAGPTGAERRAGLSSAVPMGAAFRLSITNGTAVVVGPEGLSDPASAQVVYTLTQFPSVKTVRIDGGNAGGRAEWERLTPPILVLTPTPGDTVTSPVHVAGTANTFEATLQLELRDGAGNVLERQTVTATSGSGTRGTFQADLPFSGASGAGKLVAYEDSAENGKPIHVVEIPLVLAP